MLLLVSELIRMLAARREFVLFSNGQCIEASQEGLFYNHGGIQNRVISVSHPAQVSLY